MGKLWIVIGAVSGFFGVTLGAMGAHFLAPRLDPSMLDIFKTGVQYQIYHALALMLVGLWSERQAAGTGRHETAGRVAGWCFSAGSVLFSGSLYALSLTGLGWFGAITPVGGTLLLVGWLAFAVAAAYRRHVPV